MKPTAVTVGIPVTDLPAATAWYRSTFLLGDPDLEPMEGIVEFDLGPFWLQLVSAPDAAGGSGMSVNISVADAASERDRLDELGYEVSEVGRVEDVVEFFTLTDPDGNEIGFVTELG